LIYLRDQTKFPLSLGLYGLGLMRAQSGADYNWTVVMAGNMLMTVPVIAVFFLFQRYFVQGMSMTGMKGCPAAERAMSHPPHAFSGQPTAGPGLAAEIIFPGGTI